MLSFPSVCRWMMMQFCHSKEALGPGEAERRENQNFSSTFFREPQEILKRFRFRGYYDGAFGFIS